MMIMYVVLFNSLTHTLASAYYIFRSWTVPRLIRMRNVSLEATKMCWLEVVTGRDFVFSDK
jgi:hypothetical protein